MRIALLIALIALGGCSDRAPERDAAAATGAGAELEAAAIAAGVIADPNSADPTGLDARGSDRVCVLPAAEGFRIGIDVDYGDGQHCAAAGTAQRDGERLHVQLEGKGDCAFDARFEGDRVVVPGKLPKECASYCTGRAALSGVEVDRLSDSASEARAMRGTGGRLLCGDGG
jgi:hypothetical protein